MEKSEKTIITSERANYKLISLIIALIGVVVFIIVWSNATRSGFYHDKIVDGNWNYVFTSMFPFFASYSLLPFVVIALIFYFMNRKVSLTVTDKRVYGTAAFGKRVDLPLDKISAVGTSAFKGIAVTSASGAIKFSMIKIKFSMIKNNDEMHHAISQLLMERQDESNKPIETVVKQEIPQSNADELAKFKSLLDSGIITQEEFEAKKKQLLGL